MELGAQPICLPICMNTYFFHGRFVLHLQTGNVNRSAISSGAFAVFPLEIHWIQSWNTPPCLWNSKLRYPPTSSEFQSKKPPLSLGIPRCHPWYGMDIFWNHPILAAIWLESSLECLFANGVSIISMNVNKIKLPVTKGFTIVYCRLWKMVHRSNLNLK